MDTSTKAIEAFARRIFHPDVGMPDAIDLLRALAAERDEYLRQLDAAADLIRALQSQRDEFESTIADMERDFRGEIAP